MTQSHKNKWSTIVMTNTEKNTEILKNSSSWVKIIEEKINLAKENGFLGVILDLEVSVIPFDRITNDIVDFNKSFYLEAKKQNLGYGFLIYGDKYYRQRPYFMPEIVNNSDEILIMAYDFHRPDSDVAGAVAPIGGVEENGGEYDLVTMLKDYLANVPPNKLIMGVPYYGYNWVVEEVKAEESKRKPGNDEIGYSQAMPYEDVLDVIEEYKPQVKWNEISKVPYFNYRNKDTNADRVVYFENEESLKEKYKLVNDNNLAGVGIWALGYDGGYTELWNLLYDSFIK